MPNTQTPMHNPHRPPMSLLERICDFFASGCYSGKSPFMPGTCGTAVAFLLYAVSAHLFPGLGGFRSGVILSCALALLAIAISNFAVRHELYGREKDPPQIVIDEFSGYAISVAGCGTSPLLLFLGFLLFRFFDITKIPPARQAESLPGGFGIVLDDVVAGIYARLFLEVFCLVLS